MKNDYLSLVKKLLFFIILLSSFNSDAQLTSDEKIQIKVLKREIETAKHDSTIINAWMAWDNIIYSADPDLDFQLNRKIVDLCEKNLKKSLSKKDSNFFKKNYAQALHNLGIIFFDKGDYAKAVNYFSRSLKLKEELSDLKGQAASINNIGNIYLELANYTKATEYYERSLKISKQLKDNNAIASLLGNLGLIDASLKDFENAIKNQKLSLEIRKVIGDKKGIASCLSNIGQVYNEQGDYDKALSYYSQGLKIYQEIDDIQGIIMSQNDFGTTYFDKKDYSKAIEFGNRALSLAKKRGATLQQEVSYGILYKSYEANKNFRKAFEMHKLYTELKDSLKSEENQKEIIRQEFKYSYDKKAASDSIKDALANKVKDALLTAEKADNLRHTLEAKRQKEQKYMLYGGLLVAILLGVFVFNRFRLANKQKLIIQTQKQQVDKAFVELEGKNTEILDSINYAKRIQNAILPSNSIVKEYLKDSFIIYKPKDIVAGDFYWLEFKENKILFAAADCTGHGVPGAMVSVICNNGLNRSVREYGLTTPGEILDKTREIVIQEFEKSEDDVKDGMDIALCSIEENILHYAGANNPLWIFRNKQLIEIKADKQPIGKFETQNSYTTHSFDLRKGDTIYLFTDGFTDQFGGEKNRKYKSKAYQELLLSIQDKSMENQKEYIEQEFFKWKGDNEQVDDVCIFGVRV